MLMKVVKRRAKFELRSDCHTVTATAWAFFLPVTRPRDQQLLVFEGTSTSQA